MRLVKILFSILVVAIGFFAAICLMLLGLFTRLFRGRTARPNVNIRFERAFQHTPPRPPATHGGGDVIDVETTPVKE